MSTYLLRLFFVLIFYTPILSPGQELYFGVEARTNLPLHNFKQKLQANTFPEIAVFGLYKIPELPIAAGLSVGYGMYGRLLEKRSDLYEGSTETLRLRRNNNLLSIKGHYRFYTPWVKNEKLFVDAQLGVNHLYTRYLIRETLLSETLEEGLDHASWTMAYGLGLGYKLPVAIKNKGTHLEVKAMYHTSNPVRFLPRGAVDTTKNPGEDAVFNYKTQKASLEMFQIAVAIVGLYDIF
jgi:hypothetical protein